MGGWKGGRVCMSEWTRVSEGEGVCEREKEVRGEKKGRDCAHVCQGTRRGD